MRTLLLLVWVGFNLLEQAWAQQDVLRIGPGVTPPKLIHKAEPEYSPEARDAHIQGTSVFEVVINEQGRAANITVLSPIGFGLDERAQTAIEKWRFVPGSKDRKPVKVLATIEVNFRFAGLGFDEKTEHERTKFNLALAAFKSQDSKRQERAVTTFEELARQKLPPAMHAFGTLLRTGQFVNKDVEQGRALIAKAADKNYGPAIYEVGQCI